VPPPLQPSPQPPPVPPAPAPPAPEDQSPLYDWLQEVLRPLTDWIPQEYRDLAPLWVWWLLFLIAFLTVLLILGLFFKRIGKTFARKPKLRDWDKGWRENLEDCPMPIQPPNERALSVYHVPVRVRLVVLAPMGKELEIREKDAPALLNKIFPELGWVVAREEPRLRIWPSQLSDLGFNAAFHRRTLKPEPDGELSHWILIAGKAMIGKQAVLLGLGLWSEQPNAIGRLSLQPMQWFEILRLRGAGSAAKG
jgi:hypothetical protein